MAENSDNSAEKVQLNAIKAKRQSNGGSPSKKHKNPGKTIAVEQSRPLVETSALVASTSGKAHATDNKQGRQQPVKTMPAALNLAATDYDKTREADATEKPPESVMVSNDNFDDLVKDYQEISGSVEDKSKFRANTAMNAYNDSDVTKAKMTQGQTAEHSKSNSIIKPPANLAQGYSRSNANAQQLSTEIGVELSYATKNNELIEEEVAAAFQSGLETSFKYNGRNDRTVEQDGLLERNGTSEDMLTELRVTQSNQVETSARKRAKIATKKQLYGSDWFLDKQKLQDQHVANVLAQKHFMHTKSWVEMSQPEKKQRINQLWTKVRMFVRLRKNLQSVQDDIEKREQNELFNSQISDEEAINYDDFCSDDEKETFKSQQVRWFQFNSHTYTVQVWDSFFALVVLLSIIMTPLSICFPESFHSKEGSIDWLAFELFINSLWLIDFIINLNRVNFSRKIITLRETSKVYLNTTLVPDAVALIGSTTATIMGEMMIGKYFDLIRLVRFRDMLYPMKLCVVRFTNTSQKRVLQIQSLIFVFIAFITLGHLAACLWIYMGRLDESLAPADRKSWYFVNDFNKLTDEQEELKDNYATYIFSLYWVFETLTTVGYGDYTPNTSAEYGIVLVYEFIGFCYNAILISIMSSFFTSEMRFEDLLNHRLEQMELWMKRIELSYKPYFMHPQLNKQIQDTVADAFHFDFNLIVEEYDLYQQLTPKMQTELIKLIFGRFIGRFKYFFNSCEAGFRNEFIIWLYARVHHPNKEIQRHGREVEEVVLILQGQVDMFTKKGDKFMILPPDSIFNDYQVLLSLKSNIQFKAHTPTFRTEKDLQAPENQVRTMNLDAEKFQDLLELYPETAENLKLRALEKRSIYMYYKHKTEHRHKKQQYARMRPKKEASSARSARKHPLLYTSTYDGPDSDSDKDDCHITMPFRHGEDVHHKILHETEFESDESYEMESEEEDKLIASQIGDQNQILDTMQRTISKMGKALQLNKAQVDFSLSETFRRGVKQKHDLEGLRDDFQIVEEVDLTHDSRPTPSLRNANVTGNTNNSNPMFSKLNSEVNSRRQLSSIMHNDTELDVGDIDLKALRQSNKKLL